MGMNDTERLGQIARLLEEVRDNQKVQLERQAESLAIQREHYQVFLKQQEKTAKIQERAEAIQDKSANLVSRIQRFVPIAIAAVLVLIIYLTWLLLRFFR
jgi:uncharacterized protein YaaW (UPF0174 family)